MRSGLVVVDEAVDDRISLSVAFDDDFSLRTGSHSGQPDLVRFISQHSVPASFEERIAAGRPDQGAGYDRSFAEFR